MKRYFNKFFHTLGYVIFSAVLIVGCSANGSKKPTSASTDIAELKQAQPLEKKSATITASTIIIPEAEKYPLIQQSNVVTLTPPIKRIYQFGFNKQAINQQEQQSLEQHAEYLIANPDTVLIINGHSDTQGNREYNKFLSRERAKKVALFLIDYGVPELQIKINGLGDSQPLNDVDSFKENRRVELEYKDSRIAVR